MGEGTVPGWFAAGATASRAGPAVPIAGRALLPEAGAGAGATTGTVTAPARLRATRMRRSPFSTSISDKPVSAISFASSRTRSVSKGMSLAIPSLAVSMLRFRAFAQDGRHGVQSEMIAHDAEAADHADADRRQHRMMTEGLAGVDVGDVHLDRDGAAPRDGVPESDRGVSVGAGVDHDAGAGEPGFLEPGRELALGVRLPAGERDAGPLGVLLQPALDLRQGQGAVDVRLAPAEEVEVRAVEDVNGDHREDASDAGARQQPRCLSRRVDGGEGEGSAIPCLARLGDGCAQHTARPHCLTPATVLRIGSSPTAPEMTSSPTTNAGVPERPSLSPSTTFSWIVAFTAGDSISFCSFATSTPMSLARAMARSPLTRPRVSMSLTWYSNSFSPLSWRLTASAARLASTESGPRTGKSLSTTLIFGSPLIRACRSTSARLQ